MYGYVWLESKKAALVNCVIILIASMPCVLGYNVWSDLHLIGGRDVLDSEDFIVSNLLLPGGSLIYLLFCVTNGDGDLITIWKKQILEKVLRSQKD